MNGRFWWLGSYHAGSYCTLSRRWGKGWALAWLLSVAELSQTLRHVRPSGILPWPCFCTWNLALYLLTFCPYHGPTLPQQSLGPLLLGKPDLANPNIGCLVKLELQINKLQYSYTKQVFYLEFKFEIRLFYVATKPPSPALTFISSFLCPKTLINIWRFLVHLLILWLVLVWKMLTWNTREY